MFRTMAVTSNEKHARMTRDGLDAFYPNYNFVAEANGSITWRVVVQSSAAGLCLCSEELLDRMRMFASGYYAALKAHCSL